MPGLVPGIHVFSSQVKDVDGRDKPGHDKFIDMSLQDREAHQSSVNNAWLTKKLGKAGSRLWWRIESGHEGRPGFCIETQDVAKLGKVE